MVCGVLTVKPDGGTWSSYPAGTSFEIRAKSGFDVRATDPPPRTFANSSRRPRPGARLRLRRGRRTLLPPPSASALSRSGDGARTGRGAERESADVERRGAGSADVEGRGGTWRGAGKERLRRRQPTQPRILRLSRSRERPTSRRLGGRGSDATTHSAPLPLAGRGRTSRRLGGRRSDAYHAPPLATPHRATTVGVEGGPAAGAGNLERARGKWWGGPVEARPLERMRVQ